MRKKREHAESVLSQTADDKSILIPKKNSIYRPVDPVLRIPRQKADLKYLANRAMGFFEIFSSQRIEWLEMYQEWYLGWDDYISPISKGLFNGSSNFHIPLIEKQVNAMHALIIASIFFTDPPLYIAPQEDFDEHRLKETENFMKYVLGKYCNRYQGIFNAIDSFALNLTTIGTGILERSWETQYEEVTEVVPSEEYMNITSILDATEDDLTSKEIKDLHDQLRKLPYEEVLRIRKVFDGPMLKSLKPENVLFKGECWDEMSLDEHECVQKVEYLTASQVIAMADSGFFDPESAERILEGGTRSQAQTMHGARTSTLRNYADKASGLNTTVNETSKYYEFLVCYDKTSPDGKNTQHPSRLQYYVETATWEVPRWTYLDRISANRRIPLHMCHLYKRPNRTMGRGIVESLNSMSKMTDMLVNATVNNGILTSTPGGFYRKTGTMDPEEIVIEPGVFTGLEDTSDVREFKFSNNTGWANSFISLILQQTEEQTGIGPNTFGQVGDNVGPLRSTSGVDRMTQMRDMLHNPIYKRLNACLGPAFEGLYLDTYERMPESLRITVTGLSGSPVFDAEGNIIRAEIKKSDIIKRINIGMYATASTLNKDQMYKAMMSYFQFLNTQAMMMTGVNRPENLYQQALALAGILNIPMPERFQSAPAKVAVDVASELFMTIQGIPVEVVLNDDHESKMEAISKIVDQINAGETTAFGQQIHPNSLELLNDLYRRHEKMAIAIKKQSAQQNSLGLQNSPTAGLAAERTRAGEVQAGGDDMMEGEGEV
jgi:hypothetical protein